MVESDDPNPDPSDLVETDVPDPASARSAEPLVGPRRRDYPGLPQFNIVRRLAAGGMGTVYLAEDLQLDRLVAIKFNQAPNNADASDVQRQRFLREARTMARVLHPNLAAVYSFGEHDEHQYIIMEYIDGQSLHDLLQKKGKLSESEALEFLRQAVEGLDAAWRVGISHRDIKPANFVVNSAGVLKVVDFGLARGTESQVGQTVTVAGSIVGTYRYIAPERVKGRAGDYRSDIYSLGLLLYRMLTGREAFPSNEPAAVLVAQMQEPVPDPRDTVDVSEGTVSLVTAMTHKSPEERIEPDALRGQILNLLGFSQVELPSGVLVVSESTNIVADHVRTSRSGAATAEIAGSRPTSQQSPPTNSPQDEPPQKEPAAYDPTVRLEDETPAGIPLLDTNQAAANTDKPKRGVWAGALVAALALVIAFVAWTFLGPSGEPDPDESASQQAAVKAADSADNPPPVSATATPATLDTQLADAVRLLATNGIEVRASLETSELGFEVCQASGIPMIEVEVADRTVHPILFFLNDKDEILLLDPQVYFEKTAATTGTFRLPAERTAETVARLGEEWLGSMFVLGLSQPLSLPFVPGAQPAPGIGTAYSPSMDVDDYDVGPSSQFVRGLKELLSDTPALEWGLAEIPIG